MDLEPYARQDGCCLEIIAVISLLLAGWLVYFTKLWNDLCLRIDHDEIDELVYGDIYHETDG